MDIKSIRYTELTEDQMTEVDSLTNETLPQGQSFFLEGNEIVVIGNELRALYEAQNREQIESGLIQEIV